LWRARTKIQAKQRKTTLHLFVFSTSKIKKYSGGKKHKNQNQIFVEEKHATKNNQQQTRNSFLQRFGGVYKRKISSG